jgi:nitroreductase
MSVIDTIKTRRSVREFNPNGKVSEKQLQDVLEAALAAPSSGNLQDWFFLIIKNQKTKQRLISEGACHQDFILNAPIIIVVCGRSHLISQRYGSRGLRYSIQNAAAATQNILLAAHSLGLASCWIGSFNDQKVRQVLNLSDSYLPLAMIPLGLAAETPTVPQRKSLKAVSKII